MCSFHKSQAWENENYNTKCQRSFIFKECFYFKLYSRHLGLDYSYTVTYECVIENRNCFPRQKSLYAINHKLYIFVLHYITILLQFSIHSISKPQFWIKTFLLQKNKKNKIKVVQWTQTMENIVLMTLFLLKPQNQHLLLIGVWLLWTRFRKI